MHDENLIGLAGLLFIFIVHIVIIVIKNSIINTIRGRRPLIILYYNYYMYFIISYIINLGSNIVNYNINSNNSNHYMNFNYYLLLEVVQMHCILVPEYR